MESRFVHSVLSPLVAVVASTEAEEIARANGLPSVVELLQPFGQRIEGKVNVLDSAGHSSNLDGFALRFAALSLLPGPDVQAIRRVLVHKMGSDWPLVPPTEDAIASGNVTLLAPWYTVYRNYVCKYNGASEHESFNHPVACLLVTSTAAPNPIDQLKQLFPSSPDKLPQIFSSGFVDPQISLKHYVLLHDAARAPNVDADALFAEMKKHFGLSCRLIRVNSKADNINSFDASKVWEPFMSEYMPLYDAMHADPYTKLDSNIARASLGAITASEADLAASVLAVTSAPSAPIVPETPSVSPNYGSLMSETDVKGLETFVKEFVVQSLLPSMERSVQHWNEQVASSRRGFTGRLFTAGRRFLGTNTPATKATSPGSTSPDHSTPYPHNSQEFILRKLADYSFMLHDYKFAYSMYDSVKKDFQGNDRALKHFAGVQEMLALCVLMSDAGLRGNLESLLESSISNYLESGVSIYATRATMLVYEMLRQRENYKEASALLLRMIGEDSDLRSAVLLEQSAFSHLKATPSQRRKYAFYLVMAGDRYTKCGQRQHALRCYTGAQNVYESYGWSLIDDHNNFTIGRLHFHLGDPTAAFTHFTKLLKSGQQTAEQQASHWKEFLHIYKNIARTRPIDEVEKLPQTPVPVLIQSSINVSLVQTQHMGQTSVSDSIWDKMENDLVELGFNGKPGSKPVKLMKTVRDGGNTICAVGEPVFVTFQIKNPLQIGLELNNVTLFAQFTKSTANVVVSDVTSYPNDGTRLAYDFFDLEYLPLLTLEANETRELQLRVYPKAEGELIVQGLKLTLSDCVPVTIEFVKRGRRLNDTQKQRSGDPVYAADNTLKLTVTSPMPVLDVLFHSFPETLLSGQVERTVLEINNKGHRGLKNLKIKLSHPSFFGVGKAEEIDIPSYVTKVRENLTSREILNTANKIADTSIVDIALPGADSDESSGILVSGSTTIIPVWIRGDKIGKHSFRFLFGYQSEDTNDKIGYRKLQYSVACQVYPSLKINAFTRPSTSVLSEFILGIEIENLQGADIQLRQFSSISPVWKIKPADDGSLASDNGFGVLKGKQTSFAYFRFTHDELRPVRPNPSPEKTTTEAIVNYIINENQPFTPTPVDLKISNITLQNNQVVCNSAPFNAFALQSRSVWRAQSLSIHYSAIPPEKLANTFTLYFTDDADIVLFWEAPPLQPGGPPRFGHHFIIGINLSLQAPLQLLTRIGKNASNLTFQSRSLYAATVSERKTLIDSLLKPRQKDVSPIRLILESEKVFFHDFSNCGDLILSFSARLRNTSWENSVSYSLELPSNEANAALENDFTWTGTTLLEGTLEPEQDTTLTLRACFARKGTFDVNRWRLNVLVHSASTSGGKTGTGASYMQIPNLPYLITIN